jgi:hypothetical protein
MRRNLILFLPLLLLSLAQGEVALETPVPAYKLGTYWISQRYNWTQVHFSYVSEFAKIDGIPSYELTSYFWGDFRKIGNFFIVKFYLSQEDLEILRVEFKADEEEKNISWRMKFLDFPLFVNKGWISNWTFQEFPDYPIHSITVVHNVTEVEYFEPYRRDAYRIEVWSPNLTGNYSYHYVPASDDFPGSNILDVFEEWESSHLGPEHLCKLVEWGVIALPPADENENGIPDIVEALAVAPVCGNDVCETGETYETCPADCPLPPLANIYLEVHPESPVVGDKVEIVVSWSGPAGNNTFGILVLDPQGNKVEPAIGETVCKIAEAIIQCYPCFSYFAYMWHDKSTLVIRNGAKDIINIKPSTGVPEKTFAEPWETIRITGATISEGTKVTIYYTDKATGTAMVDTATLHFEEEYLDECFVPAHFYPRLSGIYRIIAWRFFEAISYNATAFKDIAVRAIGEGVVDGFNHLCKEITLEETSDVKIIARFESINDTYARFFMASVDCPGVEGKSVHLDFGCASEGCEVAGEEAGGEYCYIGCCYSGTYEYIFKDLGKGRHKICIWPSSPKGYLWKADLRFKVEPSVLYQEGTPDTHGYIIYSMDLPQEAPTNHAIYGSVNYRIWSGPDCPGCIHQLLIIPGWDEKKAICVYNSIPGIYPGESGVAHFRLITPSKEGTYGIFVYRTLQYSCSDAIDHFASKGGLRVAHQIGEIRVISIGPVCGNGVCEAGEDQENCCLDCGCAQERFCLQDENRCVDLSISCPGFVLSGDPKDLVLDAREIGPYWKFHRDHNLTQEFSRYGVIDGYARTYTNSYTGENIGVGVLLFDSERDANGFLGVIREILFKMLISYTTACGYRASYIERPFVAREEEVIPPQEVVKVEVERMEASNLRFYLVVQGRYIVLVGGEKVDYETVRSVVRTFASKYSRVGCGDRVCSPEEVGICCMDCGCLDIKVKDSPELGEEVSFAISYTGPVSRDLQVRVYDPSGREVTLKEEECIEREIVCPIDVPCPDEEWMCFYSFIPRIPGVYEIEARIFIERIGVWREAKEEVVVPPRVVPFDIFIYPLDPVRLGEEFEVKVKVVDKVEGRIIRDAVVHACIEHPTIEVPIAKRKVPVEEKIREPTLTQRITGMAIIPEPAQPPPVIPQPVEPIPVPPRPRPCVKLRLEEDEYAGKLKAPIDAGKYKLIVKAVVRGVIKTAEASLEVISGVCGDGTCEFGETMQNCCADCGCPAELVCSTALQRCVKPVEEVDPGVVIDIILKLERVGMRLNDIAERVEEIRDYYRRVGEIDRAARWGAVLEKVEGMITSVEEVRSYLREHRERITLEVLERVRRSIADLRKDLKDLMDLMLEAI